MNKFSLITGAALLCSLSAPVLAAVTAALDRDHVEAGESVQLMLQHDGRTDQQPDLDPLKRDFDVLGTSSGSNMQFVNGHFSSQVQLTITLSPKHDGTIRIPALQWDGEQSSPLQLTVGGGTASGSGNAADSSTPHVFLDTSLDQPQPYVQGAVTLTVRLYTDQQLYQAGLELTGNSDIAVQQLGKDQQSSDERDGHRYQVIQRQYLLQPQRSGTLTLDGPLLDAQVAVADRQNPFGNDPFFANSPFAGMMRSARPLHLRGKPIVLQVRPRPASVNGSVWLPATAVTLIESWKPGDLKGHVGEPLTRHLQLRATGTTGAQLPDLTTLMSLPDGLKAYPDQPKLDTSEQGGSVTGSRDQDIALIAQHPGHYELPAIQLSWWDTKADAPREAVLPAQSLDVLPAEGGNNAASVPVSPAPALPASNTAPEGAPITSTPAIAPHNASADRQPWFWISVGLALLWLATLAAWWYQSRRARRAPAAVVATQKAAPNPSLKSVQQACRSHSPLAARQSLLDWARLRWPEHPPLGVNAVARQFSDPGLTRLLQDLDRACYRGGDWNGDALAGALDIMNRSEQKKTGKGSAASELATLYP